MYWLANIAAVKLGKFSNAVCPNNHKSNSKPLYCELPYNILTFLCPVLLSLSLFYFLFFYLCGFSLLQFNSNSTAWNDQVSVLILAKCSLQICRHIPDVCMHVGLESWGGGRGKGQITDRTDGVGSV